MRNEIEDGMGCAGLVPTKAERAEEALIDKMKLAIQSLTERCVELERQLRVAGARDWIC